MVFVRVLKDYFQKENLFVFFSQIAPVTIMGRRQNQRLK